MNNEVSVPEPLSGTEIIEAVVFKVREQLRRDCFLSPNSAYEHFSGRIHIEIRATDCGRLVDVGADVPVVLGKEPEGDAKSEILTSTEEIPQAPPNVVRRQTDQSVPVVTQDNAGKQDQRRVKYAREKDEPTGKPGARAGAAPRKGGAAPPAA